MPFSAKTGLQADEDGAGLSDGAGLLRPPCPGAQSKPDKVSRQTEALPESSSA